MSSVGQLEPDIAMGSGWQVGICYVTWFYRKTIIDRALESDSAPYKLTMRIIFVFLDELCGSIRSGDSHREGGI